jgi:hypothetical protein
MKTGELLPGQAFQQLTKTNKVDSNREEIKDYLMAGGVGELSTKQTELLQRWEYADEMIRANMGKLNREEIANLVVSKFSVSKATAKSDLVNAEYVFSSSSPLNKAYRISLRIEFLEKHIRLAAAAGDYKAIGMMEKTLAKYYEIYPETTPVEVPKTLIFSFDIDKLKDRIIDQSSAEDVIDQQLEKYKLLDSMSTDIEELDEDDPQWQGGHSDE